MYLTITKEFNFDSAHQLVNPMVTDEVEKTALFGKCQRTHGHLFRLFVTVTGKVNERSGMIVNFVTLKEIVTREIIDELDHYNINDKVGFVPTCENLIQWIAEKLQPSLTKIGVTLTKLELYETPTSHATLVLQLLVP